MIDLVQMVVERVRDNNSGVFKLVGGLAEYEALEQLNTLVMPAVFLLPVREVAERQQVMSLNSEQSHQCTFTAIFVTRLSSANMAEERPASLHTLRTHILNTLVGWCPEPTSGEVAFESGELVDFKNTRTVWRDEFVVQRFIQVTTP